MKNGWIHLTLGSFLILLGFETAMAQGAGTAYGVVRDSGGNYPADADFSYVTYLKKDPSNTKTRADIDSTGTPSYDEASGTWVVQLSVFETWQVGDTLVVEFTDTGAPNGTETGKTECELTGTNTNCGDTSLPVELSVFEAKAGDGVVVIQWRTESETDNLGFYLYRSTRQNGDFVRITKELIKSQSLNGSAADYKYIDTGVRNGVTYFYKLEDISVNGERTMHGPISAKPNYGLSLDETMIPDTYGLSQNFPNPFNPGTLIKYQLPEKAKVRLNIYNLLGQKVRTLVDAELDAGFKSIYWDGRDDSGRLVSAGVYIYELVAGSFVATRKMVMMK